MNSPAVRKLLGRLHIVVGADGFATCPVCDRRSLREHLGLLRCESGCSREQVRAEIDTLGNIAGVDTVPLGRSVLEPPEPWEPPIPFGETAVPPFPVGVLPRTLRDFALAVSEDTQTPPDMAAMLCLAVVATCVQLRYRVQVSPSYSEALSLFVVVVAESGERKSAIVAHVAEPLYAWERSATAELKAEIEATRSARRLLEQQLIAIERQAATARKPDDRAAMTEEAKEIAAQFAGTPTALDYPRLLADDVTPEALASLMAAHGGRMGLFSAEGGIFETIGGRYNNGVANLDILLKGHTGDSVRVDRKSGQPIMMDSPALTLALAVQRDVIRGLARKDGFRGRGFIGRFLFALPLSFVGRRRAKSAPIPPEVSRAYCETIRRLLAGEIDRVRRTLKGESNPLPEGLTLTLEAEAVRVAFSERVEPRLGPGADLQHFAEWGSKLPGAAVRIAGLLHAVSCAENDRPVTGAISGDAMTAAVHIANEYLTPHAMSAIGEMGGDPEMDGARSVWDRICGRGWSSFQERDLFNVLRGRAHFKKMPALRAALGLLAERGYVRQAATGTHLGPGRSGSPTWEVNPLAFDLHPQNEHNPQNQSGAYDSADSAHSAARDKNRDPPADEDDGEIVPARRAIS